MKPTVLLVDDDPTLLMVGEAELTSQGYTVATAENGNKALQHLEENDCDIIVTDFEMPEASGLELLRGIRGLEDQKKSNLPVILVTGRNDNAAVNAAFEAGATTFLQKPINWLNLEHHLAFVLRADSDRRLTEQARDMATEAADTQRSLMMLLRHELKTPLHQIIGYAELLEATAQANSAEEITAILDAAGALNTRLTKVFLFSDLRSGSSQSQRGHLNLSEVLDSALFVAQESAEERDIDIVREIDASIDLDADFSLLNTAVKELMDNAMSSAPANSTVTLSAIRTEDGSAEISVLDEGPGFAADSDPVELLEAFSQTDCGLQRVSEGLGLGLAIVNEIMRCHDGTVRLENAEGAGARATLSMPCKANNATAEQAA